MMIHAPRIQLHEALNRRPGLGGERFVEVFRQGAVSVELYAPRGIPFIFDCADAILENSTYGWSDQSR